MLTRPSLTQGFQPHFIKIAETSPVAKYARSMSDARACEPRTMERERPHRHGVIACPNAPETGRRTRSLANGVRPPVQDQGIPANPGLTSETSF
jgi:hypothetical protein